MKTILTTTILLFTLAGFGQSKAKRVDTAKFRKPQWANIADTIHYTHLISDWTSMVYLRLSAPDINGVVTISIYPSKLTKVNDSTYTYKQK